MELFYCLTLMTILSVWYASAPTDDVLIPALEIRVAGREPLRICSGFEDHLLGRNGEFHLFEAGALSVSLSAKNTTGQQTLKFGVSGVNGIAQRYVDEALATAEVVTMTYLEYFASDKTTPASRPRLMAVVGGGFEGMEASFEGSYYDLLNSAWPRERYTNETAPGVQYL